MAHRLPRLRHQPRRIRPSVDALGRRMAKKGALPRINPAVDSYNAVSVRHGLPAGAFDLDHVTGDVDIRHADGTEEFVPLGEPGTVENPKPGEIVYADPSGVLTRHWNHRDAHRTRVTEDSAHVVFILETVHAARDGHLLETAAEELHALLLSAHGSDPRAVPELERVRGCVDLTARPPGPRARGVRPPWPWRGASRPTCRTAQPFGRVCGPSGRSGRVRDGARSRTRTGTPAQGQRGLSSPCLHSTIRAGHGLRFAVPSLSVPLPASGRMGRSCLILLAPEGPSDIGTHRQHPPPALRATKAPARGMTEFHRPNRAPHPFPGPTRVGVPVIPRYDPAPGAPSRVAPRNRSCG